MERPLLCDCSGSKDIMQTPLVETILASMQEGITVYDEEGRLLFYNQAAAKLGLANTGNRHTPDRPILYNLDGATPLSDEELPLNRVLRGERVQGQEVWLQKTDSPVTILQINGRPLYRENGALLGALLVCYDTTERKWAEQRLEVSEQRYKSLFDYNPDIVCWFDLQGRLLKANPVLEQVIGYTAAELNCQKWSDMIAPNDLSRVIESYDKALKGTPQNLEMTVFHKKGFPIELHVTIMPIYVAAQLIGVYAIAKDISERKQSEKMVYYLAYHDVLTDLPNRRLFLDRLSAAIDKARRRKSTVAVLFLDLDRFKFINDTLGHTMGDLLLQTIAKRLKQELRSDDTLARLGGDEFTFFLPHVNKKQTIAIVEGILARFAPTFEVGGSEFHITPSIGISLFPEDGEDAEAIVRHADIAMYRAKELGKNNYQFYSTEMNEDVHKKAALEKELHKALEKGELTLHYQPQVHIPAGAVIGMEALIRWQHPALGFISPSDFIPIAEETGLIIPIGEWVLRQAVAQQMAWRKKGYPPVKIAVNLSARQFKDHRLVEVVRRALLDYGMEPEWLELEITESIAMFHFNYVHQKLKALKELGIQIAIDDFGTGYSSLSYLRKFPIDKLKIDQSFVREMTSNEGDFSIVKAIVGMAQGLRLDLIAEGVENEEQVDALLQLGCVNIQGYWYSRPLTPEQMERMMLEQQPR